MITIKAETNSDGILVPETEAPAHDFGSHCDGENFFYFESQQEADDFYENLNNA